MFSGYETESSMKMFRCISLLLEQFHLSHYDRIIKTERWLHDGKTNSHISKTFKKIFW